jgi:hypothetical protein
VQRTVDVLDVWADGVLVLSVTTGDDRPGRLGFVANGMIAELSAFTVTEHLDLFGERLRHLPRLLAADGPATVTKRGVECPADRSLVLSGGNLHPGLVLTHEVELVGPAACVDLDPVHAGPDRYVRVRLQPSSYRVLFAEGGTQRCVGAGEHDRVRTCVRTRITRDAVVVRVGGRTYRLPNPAPGEFGQRVALTGATLRGIEMTRITGNDLGDPPTE